MNSNLAIIVINKLKQKADLIDTIKESVTPENIEILYKEYSELEIMLDCFVECVIELLGEETKNYFTKTFIFDNYENKIKQLKSKEFIDFIMVNGCA